MLLPRHTCNICLHNKQLSAPVQSAAYESFSKLKNSDYSIKNRNKTGWTTDMGLKVLKNQLEAGLRQTTLDLLVTLGQPAVVREG